MCDDAGALRAEVAELRAEVAALRAAQAGHECAPAWLTAPPTCTCGRTDVCRIHPRPQVWTGDPAGGWFPTTTLPGWTTTCAAGSYTGQVFTFPAGA